MESIQGFLLINIYAFLVILSTCIVFFSKKRLKQLEDETYKNFLLANIFMSISGLILGIFVSPTLTYNSLVITIFNKLYLVSLMLWIFILTFYIVYVSLKDVSKVKLIKKIYYLFVFISLILILILPINVEIIANNGAVASGPSILFTYIVFGVGFIIQIVAVLQNYKNLKNKKYIPLYLLIVIGSIVLIMQIINPTLNYLINPALIFVAVIMYHTIENPDTKLLDEVHRAKEISDSANEEKTMFLYNMTGAIRDITKDIDYSADSILDESDNKKVDIEVIKTEARDIKASTARFTTMTNEILDISQIDSGNIKIYNDKYNLKLIIKELVQIYKSKSEKKGIEFRTSIASDIPEYLYGDSVSLKKALIVILDNSTRYTESGYIEFNISMIMKRDIARLIITIEDSGIGIKAEELDRIFNKKSDKEENTNLNNNLYNARKLITLMNGTIMPSSIYGKGTTIKVVLDQKIVEEEKDNLTKYENLYDKKKILLVDDNEASGKILLKLIEDTNITLDIVTTGKECLDKIRNKEKYDLILLDEDMHPLDGLVVMKKLKEIRSFNTKVILLTKNNDYEYNEDYLNYGFSDYLLKPIDKNKLFEKIDKYLMK